MEFVKEFRSSRIKNSELKGLWESAGVVEHCKISNSKHQITNKFQIPIFNDRNRFGISNFGHCDLFDICDLLFGISGTLLLQQTAAFRKDVKSPLWRWLKAMLELNQFKSVRHSLVRHSEHDFTAIQHKTCEQEL